MKLDMSKISKKSRTIAATAFVLGVVAMGGAAVANADTTTTAGATAHVNPMSSLVSAIASKFNLSTTDVQAVVDQVMTQDRADMEARQAAAFATRLNTAVSNGKITQAQADLIKSKQAEVKSFMDSLKGKTQADRKSAIESEMTSLKQWATANDIPAEFAMFGPMGGRGHGSPGKGGFGPRGANASSTPAGV